MEAKASTSPDLSTATTQELLDEIKSRSDSFIFSGMFKADQRSSDIDYATCVYHGGIFVGIGLCEQIKIDLHQTPSCSGW